MAYNILINIPNVDKKYGGVYQYSLALLHILANSNSTHNFFVLCNNPEDDIISIINNSNFKLLKDTFSAPNKYVKAGYKLANYAFILFGFNRRLKQKDAYDLIIKEHNIDIIHTPYQDLINKKNVKCISTMHDVQELYFPQFFSSAERAQRAIKYKIAIDKADAVIVSYNHINNDILKYFDKPKDQVHTVLLDMQHLWFDKIKTDDKSVLNKYKLPTNYLLCPASTWEHKNHIRLIEAINLLKNTEINLVCTGHKTDYFKTTIEPLIEKLGLNKSVQFLGIVTDEALYQLYQSCKAVVIPTLYEAGSFPLMESILMGIPVICANTTSLPETIGDNAFVFNPLDVEDMSDKINKIWSDENFRTKNIELHKIQANKLKFSNASSKIEAIYQQIMMN